MTAVLIVATTSGANPIDCNIKVPAVGQVARVPDGHQVPADAIRLGDTLDVWVCHLDQLYDDVRKHQKTEATLFINGLDAGIEPETKDLQRGVLRFHLERNDKNEVLWSSLLRDPFSRVTPDVRFSVGVPGEKPLDWTTSARPLKLYRLRLSWLSSITTTLVALTLIGLIVLAWKTDMLRNGPKAAAGRQPYSLARTQMAWWFFLILAGYVVISQISGDADPIPVSLLALMGISAATALGAVAIDATSSARIASARTRLGADLAAAQAQIQSIKGQITATTNALAAAPAPQQQELQNELELLQKQLAAHQASARLAQSQLNSLGATPKSQNFLLDILTDDDGAVALHRLQIVVWTL
ncbi:MAG TPA: hypothetical protein VNN08_11775, partial [Thermoanaerobaculia bacterium]|nr:hypothetical protein [Thermoanaerobaculia bacterium]